MERTHFPKHAYLHTFFERQITNGEVSIHPREKIRYGRLGEADHATRQITILTEQTLEQRVVTVLHELLHIKYPRINEDDIEQHKAKR